MSSITKKATLSLGSSSDNVLTVNNINIINTSTLGTDSVNKKITRRTALKLFAASSVVSASACQNSLQSPPLNTHTDNWGNTFDRTWLGGEYWANPMEDWRVVGGAAECQVSGGQRSVHSLTHQLKQPTSGFKIAAHLQRLGDGLNDGGGGFRLGAKSELNEYRSNCFVQEGFDVGVLGGELIMGDERHALQSEIQGEIELQLLAQPSTTKADHVELTLAAYSVDGDELGRLSTTVPRERLIGNVAVISNFTLGEDQNCGTRYRFRNWLLEGAAFDVNQQRKFGPILWAMYTLSDSRTSEGFVMKMSALTGPMGEQDSHKVELQIKEQEAWRSVGQEQLDRDAWVATFRVANWDEQQNVEYRLVYRERHKDGSETPDTFTGEVKANPIGRPMKMAALTCQNDYGFPYEPVALNVKKLNPDLVYFSGDQIYETHGGFGFIREPSAMAILNILRKYYQFGWAFKEVMRNSPTVVLPDDHDVLQGNLWGEGGAPIKNIDKDPGASVLSGYAEPVRVVNMVHRSSLAHHPDAYDPTPMPRGISVYYGELVYGGVGFAILADRQWKSGPERINVDVGVTGEDEAPSYYNLDYNPDGLELLGKRQEDFLTQWSSDWRGHTLKAVLSQTVFAGIATHQPLPDRYLKYDFDSGGWPSKARNRAVELMRPAMALHICGDTHLGTLSQYGVEHQRDSNWAFCTPAISAGWPRWWQPDAVGLPYKNRPSHGLDQTGEYLDSFGNRIYVYAAANPEVGKSANRYRKAHEKGSGFGVITFDIKARTYTLNAYRFLIDVADGDASNQFPGWPVTIHQEENKGKNRLA